MTEASGVSPFVWSPQDGPQLEAIMASSIEEIFLEVRQVEGKLIFYLATTRKIYGKTIGLEFYFVDIAPICLRSLDAVCRFIRTSVESLKSGRKHGNSQKATPSKPSKW